MDIRIKIKFDNKVDQVIKKLAEYGIERERILGIFLYGSQNYGMSTEESDFDFKVIIFPTFEDFIYKRKLSKTYQLNDIDEDQIEVKEIGMMLEMWKKGNPAYLEILDTQYYFTDYPDAIRELKSFKPASVNVVSSLKAIKGMAMQKLNALEHPYPSKRELLDKHGYDSKQLTHILRLEHATYELYSDLCKYVPIFISINKYTMKIDHMMINILLDTKKYKYSLEQGRVRAQTALDNIDHNIKEMIEFYGEKLAFNEEIWNKMQNWMVKLVKDSLTTQLVQAPSFKNEPGKIMEFNFFKK